jgi:2-keto-4-pentenoate hydratase/2-oxohepta-3-ene-1,7-dioic acid hydratase in catechol pathway
VRLARIAAPGGARTACVVGEEVVDLSVAAPSLPTDLTDLLAAGADALAAARRAADAPVGRLPLVAVRLLAPIRRPPKFLAIGLNYADHVAESRGMGYERPPYPVFFNKQSTCVIGPGEPIHRPRVSTQLDYEGELGFVIGRRCRHVPREQAPAVVAGFLVVNDVSVRDWQRRAPTMTLGKSFDTHGPIGPWLVTPDEVGDPHALGLRTWVDGELRQDSNTRHLLFDCWDQIAHLSTVCTLEVGDVVSTGTPAGVGAAMQPPRWLAPGSCVRIEIDRIGALENPVIEEPGDTACGWGSHGGPGDG